MESSDLEPQLVKGVGWRSGKWPIGTSCLFARCYRSPLVSGTSHVFRVQLFTIHKVKCECANTRTIWVSSSGSRNSVAAFPSGEPWFCPVSSGPRSIGRLVGLVCMARGWGFPWDLCPCVTDMARPSSFPSSPRGRLPALPAGLRDASSAAKRFPSNRIWHKRQLFPHAGVK